MNKVCWKSWAACIYLLNVCLYLRIYTHKTHYTCYIFLYTCMGACMKKSTKFCGLAEEDEVRVLSCDSTQCLVASSMVPCVHTPSYPGGCDTEIP